MKCQWQIQIIPSESILHEYDKTSIPFEKSNNLEKFSFYIRLTQLKHINNFKIEHLFKHMNEFHEAFKMFMRCIFKD